MNDCDSTPAPRAPVAVRAVQPGARRARFEWVAVLLAGLGASWLPCGGPQTQWARARQPDLHVSGGRIPAVAGSPIQDSPTSPLSPALADAEPFPRPASKKGLQVQMVDDALSLGIHHAALNVSLGALLETAEGPGVSSFTWEGHTCWIQDGYVRHLDRQIEPLSRAGVVVYLILLAYPTGDPAKDARLLHPAALPNRDFTIGGFNLETAEGAATFRTLIAFLARRYARPDGGSGRVWGWIVGNEVNSQRTWYNLGRMPLPQAAAAYERAVRATHEVVSQFSPHARCYLSFDHHWTASMPGAATGEAYGARPFLDQFAKIAREGGDFPWHVAYHPYPDDLGNPRTWLDSRAWPQADSPHVTFKNLEVLCRYLERPELTWDGRPRRVILSEQGIHCLATPDGEQLQAAGFAYAWEKVARLPGIDALIWHRHVDHAHEGGLRLGLWTNQPGTVSQPGRKRPLYFLFQQAGTPEWPDAAAFALPLVQLTSWDQLAP